MMKARLTLRFISCHTPFLLSQSQIKHRARTPHGAAWYCPKTQLGESIMPRLAQKSRKKINESAREMEKHSASLATNLKFKERTAKLLPAPILKFSPCIFILSPE